MSERPTADDRSRRADAGHARRDAALAGHESDLDRARNHVDDPDERVRVAALHSIQRLAPPDLGDDLLAALDDRAPRVRTTALELIGRAYGAGPSAGDHLSEPLVVAVSGRLADAVSAGLTDADPAVVEAAAWAVGELGLDATSSLDALQTVARLHDDALCRESAVAALGAIGHDATRQTVLGALDDKPAVRRRAVLALTAFRGPDVEQALDRARSDPDRQVRDAVEELLGPDA